MLKISSIHSEWFEQLNEWWWYRFSCTLFAYTTTVVLVFYFEILAVCDYLISFHFIVVIETVCQWPFSSLIWNNINKQNDCCDCLLICFTPIFVNASASKNICGKKDTLEAMDKLKIIIFFAVWILVRSTFQVF